MLDNVSEGFEDDAQMSTIQYSACFQITRDVPGISESSILEAFDSLSKGSDMVLGPTVRGGYYCIGFNKRAAPHLRK